MDLFLREGLSPGELKRELIRSDKDFKINFEVINGVTYRSSECESSKFIIIRWGIFRSNISTDSDPPQNQTLRGARGERAALGLTR